LGILYLVNDNGTALLPGKSLTTSGMLSNSQCTITWNNAVSVSGNNLALSLNVLFSGGFSGNRVVYLAARDTNGLNNTGWQAMGTWLAAASSPFPF
jgi:hypothetical protein